MIYQRISRHMRKQFHCNYIIRVFLILFKQVNLFYWISCYIFVFRYNETLIGCAHKKSFEKLANSLDAKFENNKIIIYGHLLVEYIYKVYVR